MIIKSTPGKGKYYNALSKYMLKGCVKSSSGIPLAIVHGMSVKPHDLRGIAKVFKENAKPLKKRKNGNYLLHEIISLPKDLGISKEKQVEILYHLMGKYIEKRANLHLAFGVIHLDKDHPHTHIMLSSNEIGAVRNNRSKTLFIRARRELEHYQITKLPEAGREYIYDKRRNKKKKLIRKSRIEVVQEITSKALAMSYSIDELQAKLNKHNLEYYSSRGASGVRDLALQRDLEVKYKKDMEIYLQKKKDRPKRVLKSDYSFRFSKMPELETALNNLLEYDRAKGLRRKKSRRRGR